VDAQQEYLTAFLPGLLLTGAGVGLTITNLSAAVSSTIPPAEFATGTATFGAARQLGATLGVALLLAVAPASDAALDGARDGWLLIAVLAGLGAAAAAATGRAHHPDLAGTSR
jgi:hypothetical protein